MRYDRDCTDRGGAYDRDGTAGGLQLLAAYPESSSDVYARLQIPHNLAGYLDTDSDTHGALLLALAAHADSGTDIYARLRLGQNMVAHADTDSDVYARLQITQLLASRDVCSIPADYGRQTYDRMTYDRQFTQTTPALSTGTMSSVYARIQLTNYLAGHSDTDTSEYARLRLDQLLSGHVDSETDIHAALLLALAAYIESNSSVYARLQIGQNLKAHADTDSDEYSRLQISQLLKAQADTKSDVAGRLQITHNLTAQSDTVSDIYAQLRQTDSWTFAFAGTLAAGQTLCIDTRDYTVKNDGVNAMADFTGEFPSIFPRTNWVIYTDSAGSRTVTLIVSKRDRKV